MNAALIEANPRHVLWTGQFEREEGQLTELQEQMAQAIVKALGITGVEGVRFSREHSTDLDAQRLYLMSLAQWNLQTIEGITQGIELARLRLPDKADELALAY